MIAEKTGWTPQEISTMNVQTLRSLIEAWSKLADEYEKGTDKGHKPSEVELKAIQHMLKKNK